MSSRLAQRVLTRSVRPAARVSARTSGHASRRFASTGAGHAAKASSDTPWMVRHLLKLIFALSNSLARRPDRLCPCVRPCGTCRVRSARAVLDGADRRGLHRSHTSSPARPSKKRLTPLSTLMRRRTSVTSPSPRRRRSLSPRKRKPRHPLRLRALPRKQWYVLQNYCFQISPLCMTKRHFLGVRLTEGCSGRGGGGTFRGIPPSWKPR